MQVHDPFDGGLHTDPFSDNITNDKNDRMVPCSWNTFASPHLGSDPFSSEADPVPAIEDTRIFGLFDYDPHGIDIFLCYRFGSMSKDFAYLSCPGMKWIGVSYNDISRYYVDRDVLIPLTALDKKKCGSMMRHLRNLSQTASDQDQFLLIDLQRELSKMMHMNLKAEIQCIDEKMMVQVLLPTKMESGVSKATWSLSIDGK